MAQYHPGAEQDFRKPMHDKRREIILGIKSIQPVAGKNLRDVEVPQRLYELAKEVAEEETTDNRFRKVHVYQLLLNHIHVKSEQGSVAPEATLAGWQQASKALFRYALNLVLAPKRPEFKKMKLSSSFYVYNISRNLHGAEQVFVRMGYQLVERQGKGGQDLVYEGDVKPGTVLETATDLLVMHEEIGLIRELMARGAGHMTLEQAIMQRWQTNTTGTAGVQQQPHPHPQPQRQPQLGPPSNPQEGIAAGSHDPRGGVPPQPPHQMMYGQPPQQPQPPTAQGPHRHEREEYGLPPLDAGVAAQIQQKQHRQAHEDLHSQIQSRMKTSYENAELTARGADQPQHVAQQLSSRQWESDQYSPRQPQGVDHTLHHPGGTSQVFPASAHPVPPDATLYQNVPYQDVRSESTPHQNIGNFQQPEAGLEKVAITQQMENLFQEYPQLVPQQGVTGSQYPVLAGLPPQQQNTEQPASDDEDLYGDDSNPVPVDTQPGPSAEELYSFDLRDLPPPVVRFTSTPASTPASECQSGITSSLVHSRSIREGGHLSLLEEQPLALGDEVNDPEYQRQLQQQHDYSQGQSPSTDSNMSIDLYGSGPSQQLEKIRRIYSRDRSTSTDSKESVDLYGSGHHEKYALHPVPEEPANPPSDPAPPHPSPSPLSHGTAHPQETNTQHPVGRPVLQVQGSQDDAARPIEPEREVGKRPEKEVGKGPVPTPRALKQQAKSHSVDEVEQDGERGGRKHHVMRTSASGSDLLQYERRSQSSEPSSPGRLDKPTPRPRRSRSPSPLSSTENSPSASPTPSRHKMPPVPEHSSQPPGPQLGVGMPPKAQSVDTETQRKKEFRRQNPVSRFSSGGLEAVAAALAHTSQASPSPAYGPEPPPTQKSSCDLPPNAPVLGISPLAAAAAKRKQGNDLSSNLPSDQLPPSQPSYGQPSYGQPSYGQPLYGQPLYGQPYFQAPGQLPQSHSSQPQSGQLLQNKASSQPLHSQQITSQPPTQVLPNHPSQPPPDQPLAHNVPSPTSTSRPLSQPLHSQHAASQPSSHPPDWPQSQQEQHRQPPRELPATHPPSDQRTLGPPGPLPPKSAPSVSTNTAAAERVDTCESDQSNLDQHRPNRQSIESLEKNLGQDNSKLRRQEHGKEPVTRKRSYAISDSSNPHRKSKESSSSAEDGGFDDSTTTTDVEPVPYSLGDTWVCSYCTNLVQATLHKCEICGHEKLETTV